MKEQESILNELEGLRSKLVVKTIECEELAQASNNASVSAYWWGSLHANESALGEIQAIINRAKERKRAGV